MFSLGTVVAGHVFDYKRPLVYRADPVRVEIWVTKIGVASFICAYEVRDDGVVYATAKTTLVPFDLAAQSPRRLAPEEKFYLEQYLQAE
jgi:acyl-CoA thioester hydrolase